MGGVLSMTQVPAVHLKCVAIIFVFLVQAASVKFVPLIPIVLSLRVAVAVDADLTARRLKLRYEEEIAQKLGRR